MGNFTQVLTEIDEHQFKVTFNILAMRRMLLLKLAIHSMSAHTQEAYDIPLMKVLPEKDIISPKAVFQVPPGLLIRPHNLVMDSHLSMLVTIQNPFATGFIIKIRIVILEPKTNTGLTQMRTLEANQLK